jgi:hypothetical protein
MGYSSIFLSIKMMEAAGWLDVFGDSLGGQTQPCRVGNAHHKDFSQLTLPLPPSSSEY